MDDLQDILVGDDSVKEFIVEYKGKEYKFKIKELPWIKISSILSKCIKYEKEGASPDLGEFYLNYLDEAIIEAPWPKAQTKMFARRLGKGFGKKLESHLPSPFDDEDEELKKE